MYRGGRFSCFFHLRTGVTKTILLGCLTVQVRRSVKSLSSVNRMFHRNRPPELDPRPCERVQLLRHRIEEVPAPKEQMKQLKVLEKGGKAWLQVPCWMLPCATMCQLLDLS